jgi:hypothetical protein
VKRQIGRELIPERASDALLNFDSSAKPRLNSGSLLQSVVRCALCMWQLALLFGLLLSLRQLVPV